MVVISAPNPGDNCQWSAVIAIQTKAAAQALQANGVALALLPLPYFCARQGAHYESSFEKLMALVPADGHVAVSAAWPSAVRLARASKAKVTTYY